MTSVGPKIREKNRNVVHSREEKRSKVIFSDYAKTILDLLNQTSDNKQEFFETKIRELSDEIHDSEHSARIKTGLLLRMNEFIQNVCASEGLNAFYVNLPVVMRRSSSRRSEAAFIDLKKMRCAEKNFQKCVLQHHTLGKAEWIGLAIWSAATRGLLLEGALLRALALQMLDPEGKDLYRVPALAPKTGSNALYVRLLIQSGDHYKSGPFNQRSEHGLEQVCYWQPDPLTLALLSRAQHSTPSNADLSDVETYLSEIIDHKGRTDRRCFSQTAALGAWFNDDRPELDLSEALITALSGHFGGASYDDVTFACLHKLKPPKGIPTQIIRATPHVSPEQPDSISKVYDALSNLISEAARNNSKSNLIQFLQNYILWNNSHNVCHMMAVWYLDLLKKDKVSTVRTYHARIGSRLVDEFEDDILTDLERDEIEERYEILLSEVPGPESRARVGGVLFMFHNFCVKCDIGIDALGSSLWPGAPVSQIRTRIIPYRAMLDVTSRLKNMAQSQPIYGAIQLALILSYRTGLRRTEVCKVRTKDIEASQDNWLFVTKNKYGSQKSNCADRRIKLSAFFPTNFSEHLGQYKIDSSKPFLWGVAREKLAPAEVTECANEYINHSLKSIGWTFHHLRHSCASMLFLIACDETELCEAIFGMDAERQRQVLLAFAPNAQSRQPRFAGLAAFMGHADVSQTFASYIHLIPDAAACRWRRLPIAADDKKLIKMIWPAIYKQKELNRMAGDAVNIFHTKLGKRAVPIEFITTDSGEASTTSPSIEFIKSSEFAVDRFHKSLLNINDGSPLANEAALIGLPPEILETVMKRGRLLASERTTKGNPRYNWAVPSGQTEPFLPQFPYRPAAVDDAKIFMDFFFRITKNLDEAECNDWFLRYCYANSSQSNTGVYFRDVDDLEKFMAVFSKFNLKSRLHLIFELPSDADTAPWIAAVPNASHKRRTERVAKTDKAKGRVILIIPSPAKAASPRQRGSTRVQMSEGWCFAIAYFMALRALDEVDPDKIPQTAPSPRH